MITRCCQSARRTVSSLKFVGFNSYDLHPIVCVKIWHRMILSTSFYACELLSNICAKDIIKLENTQRHFARVIQGLDHKSSTDTTIANLGMWSLTGFIDKCRLLLLGRLCTNSCFSTMKHIVCSYLATVNVDNTNASTSI